MGRRTVKIDHRREVSGIIYLMAALILAAAYYLPAGSTGWIGRILAAGGRGLIGMTALALPVILLYMAFDYFLEKRIRITRRRFVHVLLILLGAAAILQVITLNQADFRGLTIGDSGQPEAFRAIILLWRSSADPGLTGIDGALPGGLLGGGIALGLEAVASKIGSLILLGALLLSQLVLLLNVSLTHAAHRTAAALQQTRAKVDEAVRSSVASIKESRQADIQDPKSFDLDLAKNRQLSGDIQEPEKDDAQSSEKSDSVKKKYSLLETLKKLWQEDDFEPLPALPAEELSVPGFLQQSETAVPPVVTPVQEPDPAGIRQRSAFDLKLKEQDWPMSSLPEDEAGEPAEEPAAALPAGVHRIGQGLQTEAEPGLGREHWADRTAETAGATVLPVKKTTVHGAPGSQMAISLPYQAPPVDLLREDQNQIARSANNPMIQALGKKLENTLGSFGIQATVVHVTTGPTITRFELSPGPGVKVSRIVSLSDDIALNLAAMGVRIEAPIPGKSAIGIEIPNKETSPVLLRGLLESPEFKRSTSPLTAALGRDIQGNPILCDLAKMPHLLIAGATGSGKSVCINSILMSILYRSSPDDVRMMMIDPKVVELSVYNGIPHLLAPVVTDPKKAANTLMWAVNEMVRRYGLFADKAVRDINSYNAAAQRGDEDYEKLPLILFVIDELSDLMATTPTEVEDAIARLTAMARAAGIHLIIATQRPSVDVITGVIKANIPSRIAFAVASQVDSRTILDMGGAEKLLGKGDMLYYPQSSAKPIRGQGAFITDTEVEHVLTYIKTQHTAEYDQDIANAIMTAQPSGNKERDNEDDDELLPQALDIVVETGYASVSLLQRRMKLGYPRAARLIDALHEKGFVGPFDGSKPRKVLITQGQLLERKAREGD